MCCFFSLFDSQQQAIWSTFQKLNWAGFPPRKGSPTNPLMIEVVSMDFHSRRERSLSTYSSWYSSQLKDFVEAPYQEISEQLVERFFAE